MGVGVVYALSRTRSAPTSVGVGCGVCPVADEIRSYRNAGICRSGSRPRLCYPLSMENKPHGCNLRKGRVSLAGHVYLATVVTQQRQPLFADINAGRFVVREMMQVVRGGYAGSLAFVVMPDHVHWLFSLADHRTLSSVVGAVKRHSARKINTEYASDGRQIWQRGFHDHALRRDEDVVRVARYVVANPLRAGLVKRVGDYPLWDAVWL